MGISAGKRDSSSREAEISNILRVFFSSITYRKQYEIYSVIAGFFFGRGMFEWILAWKFY